MNVSPVSSVPRCASAPAAPRPIVNMPWLLLYLLLAVKEVFPQKPTFTKLSDIYWNATNPM